MNKTLFLVRGLPGSGKSTIANRLSDVVMEADLFFMTPNGYQFDGTRISEAHEWCQDRTHGWMNETGYPIAVANTFTRQWELEPYRQMAKVMGYRVVEITVKTDLTDAELASRNLHGVSEVVIAQMRNRWEA